MDLDKHQTDHSHEVLNMGAIALDNAEQSAPQASSVQGRIGSMALSNADEKLLENDEHLVKTIRRHPIGIIGIYAEMLLGIGVLVLGASLMVRGTFGQIPTDVKGLVAAAVLLIGGFLAAILLLSAFVYRQSRLLIGDKSVVLTVQKSLFARKISRLSMSNVEDVTAEQRGILQTVFNYGTLTIQTAGEEDNFIFPYCPNPNDVADVILEARQAYARATD